MSSFASPSRASCCKSRLGTHRRHIRSARRRRARTGHRRLHQRTTAHRRHPHRRTCSSAPLFTRVLHLIKVSWGSQKSSDLDWEPRMKRASKPAGRGLPSGRRAVSSCSWSFASSRVWAVGPVSNFVRRLPWTIPRRPRPCAIGCAARSRLSRSRSGPLSREFVRASIGAGNYSAAYESRQTLRDRRQRSDAGRPVGRDVIYDMYARAKATEAESQVALRASIHSSVSRRGSPAQRPGRLPVTQWLGTSPACFVTLCKSCSISSGPTTALDNRKRWR